MRAKLIAVLLLIFMGMHAQDNMESITPFSQIPDYPDSYSGGNLIARMIDGLGFRYYWATEGLRAEDLAYRPVPDNRSLGELLQHVYSLSGVILNSALKLPNDRTSKMAAMNDLAKLREHTLRNLEEARKQFSASSDLASHKIIFLDAEGSTEFPFWNQINGALEDAVWHSGQIALLRRAAGNPMKAGVNPFLGITEK